MITQKQDFSKGKKKIVKLLFTNMRKIGIFHTVSKL